MGTRGLIGYYKNRLTKAEYNHFDSYPSELGETIREYISENTIYGLNRDFNGITLISDNDEPTPEQVIAFANFSYHDVGKVNFSEWYWLVHDCQGDLGAYAKMGVMLDNIDFIKDSLFCEWAYIINLDRNVLEIYKGFQTKRPAANRYSLSRGEIAALKAKLKGQGRGHYIKNITTGEKTYYKNHVYYNCALIAQIPLEDVGNFDMTAFQDAVYAVEGRTDDSVGTMLQPEDFVPGAYRTMMQHRILSITGLCRVSMGAGED